MVVLYVQKFIVDLDIKIKYFLTILIKVSSYLIYNQDMEFMRHNFEYLLLVNIKRWVKLRLT